MPGWHSPTVQWAKARGFLLGALLPHRGPKPDVLTPSGLVAVRPIDATLEIDQPPVKRLLLSLAALLVLGVLVFQYGGRLLTRRHLVIDYQQTLPPGSGTTLSDSLALEGIQQALRAAFQEPANWHPVAAPTASTTSILTKGDNPNAGLVLLSNSSSSAQLYAHVALDPTNRALTVVISRPK